MVMRKIKNTGDEIFPLGYGAMRLPSKNGSIDKEKAKEIIYYGIDNGINFIDTAYNYHSGESEKLLGEILKGEYRDKVKISTKLPVPIVKKREDMDKILEGQLKNLQSSIDYYFLHGIDLSSFKKLVKLNVFDFLEESKKEGKIKHIGFSYHGSKDDFKEIVDSYSWDVTLVQYNYLDENIQASYDGIKYASSKGIGIFVMEPLKGGILAGNMPKKAEEVFKNSKFNKSNVEWALSWLLNQEEITCVLSGMNEFEQIKENIKLTKKIKVNSLSEEELKTIDDVKSVMKSMLKINCATCNYCMPCPNGVNIPECFRLYNEKYLFNKKMGPISQVSLDYTWLIGGAFAGDSAAAGLCNGCGKCVRKCPQDLDIPVELNKVSKELEGFGFNQKIWLLKKIVFPFVNWISKRNH